MQNQPEMIHIVYAADDDFAPVLGVSVESLLRSGSNACLFDISVFDGGISPGNRQKLNSLCHRHGQRDPHYLRTDYMQQCLGKHIHTDRGSIMQYARLFIGRLPYDRVLYLDCDVMLRRDIGALWNTDLQGKVMAAVPDVFSPYYRRGMELAPEDPVYNDGVMLVDLHKWRKHRVEEKALAFIHRHVGNPVKNDLGVINAVLSRETLPLPPSWNAVTAFYDFTYEEMLYYRKPPSYFPKETVESAAADPAIVHFPTSFCSTRPWEEGCSHPFAGEYLEIRQQTPWADEALSRPYKSVPYRVLNRLPWAARIGVAACLQAYIRPVCCLFRERIRKIEK